MSLIFCDGFDHYGLDEGNLTDGAYAQVDTPDIALSTANPRTGDHSMLFTEAGGPRRMRRVLGGAKTTVGLGAAFWFSELPASNDKITIFGFNDAANDPQIRIVLQSTGVIDVKRGALSQTSLGDSGAPVVVAEAYTHVEVMVTFSDTVGAVEVRVDGATVISLTDVDTVATALVESSQVILGQEGLLSGVAAMYMDDLFCYDDSGSFNNTFIGDRRVLTLFPDGDTSQADWSWNAGPTAYQAISEVAPDDDTTYIFANPGGSPAPASEFEIADLPEGVSSISAVVVVNRMRKTDAGVANTQPSLVSATSETAGVDYALSEAYTYYHDVFEVDPDTSSPFTPAALNAARIKIERTA